LADPLEQRLGRIEERLDRLERLLRADAAVAEPANAAPPPLPNAPAPPIAAPAPPLPPPLLEASVAGPPPLAAAAAVRPDLHDAAVSERVLRYAAARPPVPAEVPQGDLERTIGLKWAGWFGAIVLVIGAALAFRYAYDNGWLQALPNTIKLLLMSLAGFALIAAGEVVLRRVNRLSAMGLYGAGTAVLFLSAYAGYEWYGIYARGTAFALMGIATVIGVAIAGRAGLVSIAVLSLIGGHLAPVILSARAESVEPFLLYLLFLQLLALVLCAWRAAPKWWTLRGLSFGATAIWQLLLVSQSTYPVHIIHAFSIVYAVLFQAELVVTTLIVARRAKAQSADADADHAVDPNVGLVFSMLVTAQLTLTALIGCSDSTAFVRGTWVLAIAAACGAIATLLWRIGDVVHRLAVSLRIQAAALVILAVAVLYEGPTRIWGWLVLSIAFGALTVFLKRKGGAVGAIVNWMLAIAALVWWSTQDGDAWRVWLASPTKMPAAFVIAMIIAVAGHLLATAFLAAADPTPGAAEDPTAQSRWTLLPPTGTLLHALAALLWIFASIVCLQTLAATVSLLAYAFVTCALSFRLLHRRLAYVAIGAAVTAAVKWVAYDELVDRLARAVGPTTPFFNAHLAVGLLVAGTLVGICWLRRDLLFAGAAEAGARRLYQSTLLLTAASLLTVGLSVEIIHPVAAAAAAGSLSYTLIHTVLLDFTLLWSAVAIAVLLADRLIIRPENNAVAAAMVVALTVIGFKHIGFDSLLSGAFGQKTSATLILNLQAAASCVCAAGLFVAVRWSQTGEQKTLNQVLALVVLVMAGSIEIDRYAMQQTSAEPWIVRQAAWSVWWSVFAIGTVVIGFAVRTPTLRLFGLCLFGVTLIKVALVDLSGAGTGWRILSFIGLGGLLLGTSVLYGKFGPALTGRQPVRSLDPGADEQP
jgi:uncharacterized membrane protein